MTDLRVLIEKLRVPCGRTVGHGESCVMGYLCTECAQRNQAANELERLGSEKEALKAALRNMCRGWKYGDTYESEFVTACTLSGWPDR